MKKMMSLLIVVGMAVSLAGCGTQTEKSEVKQTLRVGVECAYAPYNWEESEKSEYNAEIENHEGFYADGYDVQIAKKLGELMDRDVVFVKVSWDGLMQSLNQGQIDVIISGMLDSPEHKEAADFSDTYAVTNTEYTIMVKKNSEFASGTELADFATASILGQKGTRLDTVIDQIPEVNHVSPVDTVPAMLDRLLKNTVDGIVINKEIVPVYTAQYEELAGITFADGKGFVLDFSGICVGVKKENSALLDEINLALSKISTEERQTMFDEAGARTGE